MTHALGRIGGDIPLPGLPVYRPEAHAAPHTGISCCLNRAHKFSPLRMNGTGWRPVLSGTFGSTNWVDVPERGERLCAWPPIAPADVQVNTTTNTEYLQELAAMVKCAWVTYKDKKRD